MKKRFLLAVELEFQDPQTEFGAEQRLQSWLEMFGHTAASHGFEFLRVGRVSTTLVVSTKDPKGNKA